MRCWTPIPACGRRDGVNVIGDPRSRRVSDAPPVHTRGRPESAELLRAAYGLLVCVDCNLCWHARVRRAYGGSYACTTGIPAFWSHGNAVPGYRRCGGRTYSGPDSAGCAPVA